MAADTKWLVSAKNILVLKVIKLIFGAKRQHYIKSLAMTAQFWVNFLHASIQNLSTMVHKLLSNLKYVTLNICI